LRISVAAWSLIRLLIRGVALLWVAAAVRPAIAGLTVALLRILLVI
jgi:hypothetical protein